MLYCICNPKPDPALRQPHSPACRFQNFEADRDPDSLADLNRQRFRQEYPAPEEVTITYGEEEPIQSDLTVTELLDDLDGRLQKAVAELFAIRNPIHAVNPDDPDAIRLSGKIDGLFVVRDWLRGYRTH